MMAFGSCDELKQWLIQQGLTFDAWGQGEAKSVADLWIEVLHGETELLASPLRRLVGVVELLIERDQAILIEAMQKLASGERRYRNHLPAEKIKQGETPLVAARRCLIEEFALTTEQVENIKITVEQPVEKKRTSPSYPGLISIYQLHRARIEGFDFPAHDFSTENAAHAEGDPVKAHYWRWVTEITAR